MRVSKSIHRQLLLWLLVTQSLIGLVSLADSYFSARQTAHSAYDRVLSNSALTISERIYVDDDGDLNVDIPYVALEMLASNASDRVYYRIDSQGVLVTGYDQLDAPRAKEGQWAYGAMQVRGEAVRYASLSGKASNGFATLPYRVIVAETQNARRALTTSIFLRSVLRHLAIIAGSFVIIWLAISSALRPLQKLSEAIGRRSSEDLRPITHNVPSEIKTLVEETNGLISRLKTTLEALQRFTSNASHQLRTPMAVAHTELSLALRATSPAEKDAGITRSLTAITGAERTLSQLLMLARLRENHPQSRFARFDLSRATQEICAHYAVQMQRKEIQFSFEGATGCTITGDEILIGEAIKNLIDNAMLHPKDASWIRVSLTRAADDITCTVANDGLIPRHHFERRLGLSIVEEIVTIFGGQLKIDQSQPQILKVHLVFGMQHR